MALKFLRICICGIEIYYQRGGRFFSHREGHPLFKGELHVLVAKFPRYTLPKGRGGGGGGGREVKQMYMRALKVPMATEG